MRETSELRFDTLDAYLYIFIRHRSAFRRYTRVGLWANTWPRNVPLSVHVDPGASPDIGRWRASCLQPSFEGGGEAFLSSQSSPSLLRLCACEIASPIFASRRATRRESHRTRAEIGYVLFARVKNSPDINSRDTLTVKHHGVSVYNSSWSRLRSRFGPWRENDNRQI